VTEIAEIAEIAEKGITQRTPRGRETQRTPVTGDPPDD
jgi:hypothetical protein